MLDFSKLYTRAFTPGESSEQNDQTLPLNLVTIGELSLPSGRIVACDPLVAGNPPPFVQTVLPGRYLVDLALLQSPSGSETVAMARVTFTARQPSVWVKAICKGEGPASSESDTPFGYRAESGTGAFMDAGAVAQADFSHLDDIDHLLTELTANYRPHRYWLEQPLDRRHNVVMFSSGQGVGTYGSYFGIDDAGDTCTLVTDFRLLS